MGRTTGIIIAAAAAIVILAGVLLFMLGRGSESDVTALDKEMSELPMPSADGTTPPAPEAAAALREYSWPGLYAVATLGSATKARAPAGLIQTLVRGNAIR